MNHRFAAWAFLLVILFLIILTVYQGHVIEQQRDLIRSFWNAGCR